MKRLVIYFLAIFFIFSISTSNFPHSVFAASDATTPGHCTDTTPTFVPHLFEVDAAGSFATLNFTASKENVSGYSISYGHDEKANNYGENFNYDAPDWLIHHAIWKLPTKSDLYFKVRATNGCTAGEWSNVIKIKTSKTQLTQFFP